MRRFVVELVYFGVTGREYVTHFRCCSESAKGAAEFALLLFGCQGMHVIGVRERRGF